MEEELVIGLGMTSGRGASSGGFVVLSGLSPTLRDGKEHTA